MAEEIKPDGTTAAVVEATPRADVAAPKKRGPRAKKAAADAVTVDAAPAVKRGRKRKETSPAVKVERAATKGTGRRAAPKPSAATSAPVLAEIAELLQLEEENGRLRKALAEKLRAENADLKRRLGLN